jgi:hypothetical protein
MLTSHLCGHRHDEFAREVCRAIEDLLLHGIKPVGGAKMRGGAALPQESSYRALWEVISHITHKVRC